MQLVHQEMQAALALALDTLSPGSASKAQFETPKVAAHGDWAVTAAMQLAKPLGRNPRELAQELQNLLLASPAGQRWLASVDIAGPGFLNLRLKPEAKQQVVREVLQAADVFGHQTPNGQRLLVEFVSANPTGPLHVGHGRQAALGDALCNLFETQGWLVHREFYYNDAGVQIQTLANSTQLRAQGFKPGDAEWPDNAYNGEYIQDIANACLDKQTVQADDRSFTANGQVDDVANIRDFAVAYLRHEQDLDLQAFAVQFDHYYLESSLYTDGRVERAVASLQASGHTYESDGALWLRSTDFGDDKDRVMRKSDGSYTYFVPDVAYHLAKWERGYTKVINIQGTDHHGTIARVRAGLQAASQQQGLNIPQGYPDYVLHTMVRVMRGGEEVKISKRAGSYVTLRDLIEWTSKDAVRFFLLSRKPDTEYVFDVDLALAKNNENPVFYVQYAHARICSVLIASLGAQKNTPSPLEDSTDEAAAHAKEHLYRQALAGLANVDLSGLNSPQAQTLMLLLARFPQMLAQACQDLATHDVSFYLRELAACYHSYYDAERILVEDEATKRARLALVAATAQVLKNGLAVLGVSAPLSM
jgi:arginyl-tRNA synthetase